MSELVAFDRALALSGGELVTAGRPPIYVGVDSETHLIQPGVLAPPLVCLSAAMRKDSDFDTLLLDRNDGVSFYRKLLASSADIVIHNASFDLGVACNEEPDLVPMVFDAYRAGRIHCTIVYQKLIDIALGMRKFRRYEGQTVKTTYSLATLIELYYGEHVEKQDTWRLSYGLLDGIPISRYPEDARKYAVYDAVLHLRLWEAQQKEVEDFLQGEELPNQVEQQRAAWALHLMSMWGVRAEAEAVDHFIDHCENEIAKMKRDLYDTGIFKGKFRCAGKSREKCKYTEDEAWNVCPSCGVEGRCVPNRDAGSRSMEEIRRRVVAACERRGAPVPMTDPSERFVDGQVQTDKEALEATDDPALHILAASMTFVKHLGQWGPVCRAAILRPVCARYEVLAETGRTACSGSEGQEGTNFQNPPRKGDVRPCFIPRPGHVFCSTDADTIELRAHAQNCLELVGWSKMAEALIDQHKNKGPDLHLRLAASIIGIDPYVALTRRKEGDSEVGEARQFAKIPNFGYPGGLGAETMITYAAAQLDKKAHQKWFGTGYEEQITRSKAMREIWFDTWPENRDYFKIIAKMINDSALDESGEGYIRQLRSGRLRGGCRFTAAANGFFQGRVADAMKEILFYLADECYTGRCTTDHAHGGSNLCTLMGRSVLVGSRTVMFLHDEPILEHPEDGTESDRAERQRQLVVECLSRWMPAIPCTSSAVLTRRWWKGAEPLFIEGKLVPVKPEKVIGVDGKVVKIKWVEDRRAA